MSRNVNESKAKDKTAIATTGNNQRLCTIVQNTSALHLGANIAGLYTMSSKYSMLWQMIKNIGGIHCR